MSIYIDVDVLKAYWADADGRDKEYVDTIRTVIDHAPAAQVEPIVYATWEEWDDDWFHGIMCSACKEQWACEDNDARKTKRCPECGAHMKVEK